MIYEFFADSKLHYVITFNHLGTFQAPQLSYVSFDDCIYIVD